MSEDVTPDHILQTGMNFFSTKTLLSAVELGLFTELATHGPMTGSEIEALLGLHPRATADFLDGLLAIGFLEREGASMTGRYTNTPATARFLNRNGPTYVGGVLEMANARLYRFWADLTPALKTGKPQSEVKHTGRPFFEEIYADPGRLEQFLAAMASIQLGNFTAFATKFDFSRFSTLADVGGASGSLSSTIAQHNPHMRCTSYDLPVVVPIARRKIAERGLDGRVGAEAIDFLKDEFPRADLITMGNILHDWNRDTKKMLIAKSFRALPPGGALIAIENVIDDDRRVNAFGLMVSLNMLIETGDGFDYSGADFSAWCCEAGFLRCEISPLVGSASAAVAWK